MVGEDKRVFIIKWFKNQSFEKPMDWIITLYKILNSLTLHLSYSWIMFVFDGYSRNKKCAKVKV